LSIFLSKKEGIYANSTESGITGMEPILSPRVKICCIMSRGEARMAITAGASALGLVSDMPSGPGVIPDEEIAAIAATVPVPVATVLLTSRPSAEEIVAQHRHVRTSVIQIVDRVPGGAHAELRERLPGIRLMQVIHVLDEGAIDDALRLDGSVDAVLLDSGRPHMSVKELGGTGRRHDWTISRQIREALNIPVFLAGGLRPENVREAIAAVGPFGLDVCTGVRTDGRLDPPKLAAFMRAAKE
jgi:phosphoribosylanthranilate isomerase